MSDFEWTAKLTNEESAALRDYKDDSWININRGLRSGNLTENLRNQMQLLDQAIQKGRCTKAVTLFRATGLNRLCIDGDLIRGDKAFLSTSLRDDGLGGFFAENPVKLMIECPQGTRMAAFEHDDGGGEEHERLLPRGTHFRIKSQRTILNENDPFEGDGPFNRYYMQLPKGVLIRAYMVEPVRG